MNYRQAEASYLEPQWNDEDVRQIASTLTPEQTTAIYAEARELLGIDEPAAPEPTSQEDEFLVGGDGMGRNAWAVRI